MNTAKMSEKEIIKAALKKAKKELTPRLYAATKEGIKTGEISVTLMSDWLSMT